MACFSGGVTHVAHTRIFARATDDGKQYLVYQVGYAAEKDFALIVPLPTPIGATSDTVKFIDLSAYADFFGELAKGFPVASGMPTMGAPRSISHRVGSFDASFAASLADLATLDEVYRVPETVWEQLPEYNDYSFAVFKLPGDAQSVPPMALEFPVRNSNLLYFPTLNVLGNKVEENAYFDCDLFCQGRVGWLRSYDVARSFMDIGRAQGIVDSGQRVERFTVLGTHPNSDIVLTLNS